jgi:hypothetical protein
MAETLLIAGTRKGLFLARKSGGRWASEPLQLPMQAVYAVGVDTRGSTPRLFAGATSEHWGPTVLHSDDLGRTWQEPEQAPIAFPDRTGEALARVWQIQPGPADQPGVIYAGTEPTALFRSEDGGETFSLNDALWDHPHRPEWAPGYGGQALHTIVPYPGRPERMLVAMSAGGVYRTTDGGRSWTPSNTGIKATFLPEEDRYPEFGQCVHKIAPDAGDPERLYLQNHNGVYRTDDWGGSWTESAKGLPGEFGFAVAADPRVPGRAYLFPLVSDYYRFAPDFRRRIYRTEDAGESWTQLGENLPAEAFYSLVLRDALCTDDGDPAGVYFGTRNGELYACEGEHWTTVAAGLPDVLSVRATVLE